MDTHAKDHVTHLCPNPAHLRTALDAPGTCARQPPAARAAKRCGRTWPALPSGGGVRMPGVRCLSSAGSGGDNAPRSGAPRADGACCPRPKHVHSGTGGVASGPGTPRTRHEAVYRQGLTADLRGATSRAHRPRGTCGNAPRPGGHGTVKETYGFRRCSEGLVPRADRDGAAGRGMRRCP